MSSLKQTIHDIKQDFPSNTFSLKTFLSLYFFSPGFRILLNYRIGKFFSKRKFFLYRHLGNYYKSRLIVKRNCDFSYKSVIGKNFQMPHPIGIVVGDGVVIKDNVMVFQQVTLGSHGKRGKPLAYPIIENNVKVYSGAKIIGGITIGKYAIIGANSVVNKDVPAYATAVGIPCVIIEGKNSSF